jgi:hypothetical protein
MASAFPAILVSLMLCLVVAVGFTVFRYLDRFEASFGEELARASRMARVDVDGSVD